MKRNFISCDIGFNLDLGEFPIRKKMCVLDKVFFQHGHVNFDKTSSIPRRHMEST